MREPEAQPDSKPTPSASAAWTEDTVALEGGDARRRRHPRRRRDAHFEGITPVLLVVRSRAAIRASRTRGLVSLGSL